MTVEVVIKGHDMELTPRLRDYVEKKVSRLDHYLDTITQADVELSHQKSARSAADRQVAQLTVRGRGLLLRSEERTDDMFASVDAVLDKMQRQIERFKGKQRRGRGDGASTRALARALESESEAGPESAGTETSIVRRKRFALRPMDEQEAIDQMHQLEHDNFFVFYNAASSAINVLYRRRDGSYGLIEPELG